MHTCQVRCKTSKFELYPHMSLVNGCASKFRFPRHLKKLRSDQCFSLFINICFFYSSSLLCGCFLLLLTSIFDSLFNLLFTQHFICASLFLLWNSSYPIILLHWRMLFHLINGRPQICLDFSDVLMNLSSYPSITIPIKLERSDYN